MLALATNISYIMVGTSVARAVTVRPKGWEKATQIPPQISVKFQPFLVIFHYFCGGIDELITLVCYVIFNFKYK